MRIFIILFSILFSQFTFSQDCEPESRKHKRILNKTKRYMKKGELYDARHLLRGKSEPYFSALRMQIDWFREDYYDAQKEGLDIIEACPDGFPEVYYFLGDIAFKRKDYVKADIYFKKSLELSISDPYYSDAVMYYEKSREIADLINSPVPFEPKLMKGISTEFDEYLPIISPDQELFFFTRKSIKKSFHSLTSKPVEEFMISRKIDGNFLDGDPMSYPFNRENNEGGASITIDNKTLYYTRCSVNNNGYNNCDIYYVTKTANGWSDVQHFPEYISGSLSWESQPTVSSDGRTIIFASDRAGGYGDVDLYETKFYNGRWTKPKNLGSTINSNRNEKSPFLHTDGKTLFFCSENSPTVGGFDIFYSRKDSLGRWGKPINIGYPINSIFDESSLFVSTDGKYAYFASKQLSGTGGWDIYSFLLHEEARPKRVLFLKGELLGEDGKILQDVNIEIKNIRTKEVTTVKVNSGSYITALTIDDDDDVLITVKKKGYAFNSIYVESKDTTYDSPINVNIEMEALEKGKSFEIDNIYFDNNSFVIKSVAQEVLLAFAEYLQINDQLVIEINGFTDDVGDDRDNQALSENRAKSVYELIISNGISQDRLSYNGYGENYPVSDNNTEDGRAKNRRTEFKIIE